MSKKTFLIKGGAKLRGEVSVGGSKNAALPIVAATTLTDKKCVLINLPDIGDVRVMLEIIENLGGTVEIKDDSVEICCKNIKDGNVVIEKAGKIRASLLFLGPLLARFGEVKVSTPGGCSLGKRDIDEHLKAFEKLGAKVLSHECEIHLIAPNGLKGDVMYFRSRSVTGTENAIMAAVGAKGKSQVRLAACEPHVQDLCVFLNKIGADISNIGNYNVDIEGVSEFKGTEHSIISDYLEAGTLVLAGLITNSEILVKKAVPEHLDVLWKYLDDMGANLEIKNGSVRVLPSPRLRAIKMLKTGVYPDFPTDLQSPMGVLLTQAEGISKIFETVFNGRLNYLIELEKMGVTVEMLNPHQAIVIGPNKLRAAEVASWDLRAGAAMVLAGLVAQGDTVVTNIDYIDRGYNKLDEKLNSLGAKIKRV